jgi:hypothetical protein
VGLGIVGASALSIFGTDSAWADDRNVPPVQRKPVDIQGRDTCAEIYNELGRYIAAANAYLFDLEKSVGGVLEWSEAEAIRNKIDVELYAYTEYLAYHVADADVSLCKKTKEDGILKINEIIKSALNGNPNKLK